MPHTALLDELAWRGLLFQHTEGAAAALAAGPVSGYIGFDPTATSLHVGNLVVVMGLVHLQRAGHRPIALVGGGTGMIGDPSGKRGERTLNSLEVVEENARSLHKQLERFLDFSGERGARMLNNAEWLMQLSAIGFLRDVGKHFSVNYMTAKDSVKSRLEDGISYTEFSYMLLQAYDFLELFRREGVTLQMGGADQWGNITAGVELIRRSAGGEAHGVTMPLMTNADGQKFGKTEGGSVWLDPSLTSPYGFFQFWINADDRDVGRHLRTFTLLEREEIEALDRAVLERPEKREAQQALAGDVTARVHGRDAAALAAQVSRILFDRKADPRELGEDALTMLSGEIPSEHFTEDMWPDADPGSHNLLVDVAMVRTSLAKSKGDARRLRQQGGVTITGRRIGADENEVSREAALAGGYFLIRKGAREMALVKVD